MRDGFPSMPASVETIIRLVCAQHAISPRDVLGSRRDKAACNARHEAMYRVRTEITIAGSGPSLNQIGGWFGRDHTSVLNAIRRHASGGSWARTDRRFVKPPAKLQLVQDMWEAA